MKPLSVVTNILLSVFIVISGVTYVLNRTTSAEYLTQTAEKSDIYKGISSVAAEQLAATSARSLGVPEEAVSQAVSGLVSEEYIQTKSTEINEQVEQILKGESNKLSIEFSDLVAQANAAGLPLNSTDLKPIEVELPQNTNQATIKSAQNLDLVRFISYVLSGVLLLVSIVLAILRRSSLGLALAFIASGTIFTLFALLSKLLEAAVINLVNLPETIQELDTYVDTFVKTLVSDISNQYLTFAVALIVLGLLSIIVHRLLKPLRVQQLSHSVELPKDPTQNTV